MLTRRSTCSSHGLETHAPGGGCTRRNLTWLKFTQHIPAQRPIFGPMHAPQADHGLGRCALIQQECEVLPDGAEPHQAGDFAARGPASEDCCQLTLQLWCRPLELIPALQACLAPSNPGASWQPAADLPHYLPARAGLSAADLFGLKRCLELDNQDQSVLSAHLLILHLDVLHH